MKKAIVLSVLAVCLIAAPALAMEHGEKGNGEQTFEQRKEGILKMLDTRIKSLQEHKGCVTSAKNHDEMKTCKKKFDEEMDKNREQMKEHRKEMKDKEK